MAQDPLGYEVLANKRIVAAFVRPGVAEEVVERFEDEYVKGRDVEWTWMVHPTRSFGDQNIDELMSLALEEFSHSENKYYPYFVILIDERTTRDGSVLLVQRDPRWPPQWKLRITPKSLATFFSICDIGHTTIEDVLLNDQPQGDEQWVYDVPFDHNEEHQQWNRRVSVRMNQLSIGGVHKDWFGAPPLRVLVMGSSVRK